jgi:hypothetical protein
MAREHLNKLLMTTLVWVSLFADVYKKQIDLADLLVFTKSLIDIFETNDSERIKSFYQNCQHLEWQSKFFDAISANYGIYPIYISLLMLTGQDDSADFWIRYLELEIGKVILD